MARLLVLAKLPRRGQISGAFPDDHVFGAMEDIDKYMDKHGSRDRWPGDFVIVDIEGMTLPRAKELSEPVVTTAPGRTDPSTGRPFVIKTIHHNSMGLVDYEELADTAARQTRLIDNAKVTRDNAEIGTSITERSP